MYKSYDLMPTNGRKSFYGKAVVKQCADGSELLQSYNTKVLKKDGRGCLYTIVERLECYDRHAHKIILRYEQKRVYVVANGVIAV